MKKRDLAAELFKLTYGHTVLIAKGVPDERYFKSFAESAWQAAEAFYEAEPESMDPGAEPKFELDDDSEPTHD